MANANELMDFVKSLNNRGLLSKTIDEFDYEWVIWDYERSKVKNLSSNPMLADSNCYHENVWIDDYGRWWCNDCKRFICR